MTESAILTTLRNAVPSLLSKGGRAESDTSSQSEKDERRKAGAVRAEQWRRQEQDRVLSGGPAEVINTTGLRGRAPSGSAIGPPPLPPPWGPPPTDSFLRTPTNKLQLHADAVKTPSMQIRSALPPGSGESITFSRSRGNEMGLPPATTATCVQMQSGPPLPNISMAPSSQLTGHQLLHQAQYQGAATYPQSFPHFSLPWQDAVASSFPIVSPPPGAAFQQHPTMQGLSPGCQQALAHSQQNMQMQISSILGQPSSVLRDHSRTPPTPPDRQWSKANGQSAAARPSNGSLELSISAATHPYDHMSVSGVLSNPGATSHILEGGPQGSICLSGQCVQTLAANQGALAHAAFELASRTSQGNVQQGRASALTDKAEHQPKTAHWLDGNHRLSIGNQGHPDNIEVAQTDCSSITSAQALRESPVLDLDGTVLDLDQRNSDRGDMKNDLSYAGKKVAGAAKEAFAELDVPDWLAWSIEKVQVVSSEAASYVPFLIPGDPGDPEDRKQPVYRQLNPFGDSVDYVGVMRLVQALALERPVAGVTRASSTNRYLEQLIRGDKVADISSHLVASCNQMVIEEWNDYVVCDFWSQHSELAEGADEMLLRSLFYNACMGQHLAPKERRDLVYKDFSLKSRQMRSTG